MTLKTDKLLVSAYVRHGDTCHSGDHHDSLNCASGFKANDYVLVAKFGYLQECLDYAIEGARRGCRMLVISRIAKEPMRWHYIPEQFAAEHAQDGSTRIIAKQGA
jgi:hypothetical protein